MNKPLKDWTLGEVQKYCKITQCVDCCIGLWCKNIGEVPSEWDLSEPPRWTEQDKEDAKALKRMIKNAHHVRRCVEEVSLRLYGKYDDYILTLNNCFAALPPQTEVTLDEIIGGTE